MQQLSTHNHTRNASARITGPPPGAAERLDIALGEITSAAVAAVPGARYALVTCQARAGQVTSYGATDPVIDTPALSQKNLGRDPRLPAVRRRSVTITDPVAEGCRPEFAAAARRAGIGGILAVDLPAEGPPFGVLCLYATSPDTFTADDETIAAVFAAHAATTLRRRAGEHDSLSPDIASHVVIGHAEGVLIDRHDVAPDEARAMLTRTAAHANLTVADVAYWLVTETENSPLTEPSIAATARALENKPVRS